MTPSFRDEDDCDCRLPNNQKKQVMGDAILTRKPSLPVSWGNAVPDGII
jgi:hypothetical protein